MITKNEALKTIYEHCLECCSGNKQDVEDCKGGKFCKLFPLRNEFAKRNLNKTASRVRKNRNLNEK